MECFWKLAVLLIAAVNVEGRARIIGGTTINISNHPWQASLRSGGSHICGASFIDNKWLITAAHCVNGQTLSSLSIGHGHSDRRSHKTVSIARAIMHPNYQENGNLGYPNDIALLELSSSVAFDANTNKIALPASSNPLSSCWITGWGCTSTFLGLCLSSPNNLMGTAIAKIDPATCKTLWSDTLIQDIHVCVNEPSKSACNGDSGGPLSCMQDGSLVLAGATSWGASGCSPDYPSVYTRVSMFTSWIRSVTGLNV